MKTKQTTIKTDSAPLYATLAVDECGDTYFVRSEFTVRGWVLGSQIERGGLGLTNEWAAENLYRRGLLTADFLGDMLPAFERHLDRWTIGELARRGLC